MNKKKISLFNIKIDNLTIEETTASIEKFIQEKRGPYLVLTPNVHHINLLQKDRVFQEIYANSSLIIPDSTPLIWASKILGKPLKAKVSGSDLLPYFCRIAAEKKYRLFFLGAAPGVACKAARVLTLKNPGLQVVGFHSPPYGFEHDEGENKRILRLIGEADPDALFVGLGPPKQEKWAWGHKEELLGRVVICVGAAFDFVAGKIKRAPDPIQKLGLEWAFRLIQEPRRLYKRYMIGNPMFLRMIVREFFKEKANLSERGR
jgi:N-acetylglucosaminyldiphosphoundecaprenol N-acetyl-beta-D-mannosaminyltransferase